MAVKIRFEYTDPTNTVEVMTEGPHGAVGNVLDELLNEERTVALEKIEITPNYDPADWHGGAD